jgi:hypothetical protein
MEKERRRNKERKKVKELKRVNCQRKIYAHIEEGILR